MSIFTVDVETQLKMCGEQWETTINGDCVPFDAIFDAENKLINDGTGQIVVIDGSIATVLTKVTNQFTYNQQLTDECGTVWYFREALKENDGVLSRCSLTEKPNAS